MKIGILAGDYPPQCSGLGDHTFKVATELSHQGHVVAVWTAEAFPVKTSKVELRSFAQPWRSKALRNIMQDIVRWAPDAFIIQYTPQSIAPETFGNHFRFSLWVRKLKVLLKKPIIIIVHEMNYPVGLSLRGLLLGVPQVIQFAVLACTAHALFMSTELFWKRISKMFFWKRSIHWLPVGANIEANESSLASALGTRQAKLKVGIDPQLKILLYFGGLHPTHLIEHIKAAFLQTRVRFGTNAVKLICIGTKFEVLAGNFKTKEEIEALNGVKVFHYLPPLQVSDWLNAADLVLAPFMDGISTRRGSAMASFSHGKTVLTNLGCASGNSIPWNDFCVALPVNSIH